MPTKWVDFPRLMSWVQALGFLNLLMPTHAVAMREGDWAAWLPTWLGLQDAVAHCRWWDATWMDLVSRVAKHDKHGMAAGGLCKVILAIDG
jgi:hypothetical protein